LVVRRQVWMSFDIVPILPFQVLGATRRTGNGRGYRAICSSFVKFEQAKGEGSERMNAGVDIRNKCWDEAVYCFGTAYVFERRSKAYKRLLQWLTFLGLAVPLAVGGIVMSFGVDLPYTAWIITVASILGLAQLILSLWSLVAKWDDMFAYSVESCSDNYRLSDLFKNLAQFENPNSPEHMNRYELLQSENRMRSGRDNQQTLSDREKRTGLRAALRQFQRTCVACKAVPMSMKPSKCDVCGNF